MGSGVRLLVLGKQGAGKGTQAVRIARHYGVPHISTGDMFRAAAAARTPFGLKAQEFMKRGELVPDDVVIGVVAERLAKDDAVDDGFVLDGFPRTRVQAEELQRLLGPGGLDAAVDIDVPTGIVLDRISGRRVCRNCGATYHVNAPPRTDWKCDKDGGDVVQRDDDKPESVRPGATTLDIDRVARDVLDRRGARSNFLGYHGFPAVICTSPNDVIVHGIPGDYRLEEGDILSIDAGAIIEGWHADAAITIPIGEVDDEARRLMDVTRRSLEASIAHIVAGNHLGDVGAAVAAVATAAAFTVLREY